MPRLQVLLPLKVRLEPASQLANLLCCIIPCLVCSLLALFKIILSLLSGEAVWTANADTAPVAMCQGRTRARQINLRTPGLSFVLSRHTVHHSSTKIFVSITVPGVLVLLLILLVGAILLECWSSADTFLPHRR